MPDTIIHNSKIGTIEDVTGLTVRKVDTANLLNINWTPVFAYNGLNVFYNICLNEMTAGVQADTWFNYSTTDLDPCQYLNMSITPFINKTGIILKGRTIHWDDIPIEGEASHKTELLWLLFSKSMQHHLMILH